MRVSRILQLGFVFAVLFCGVDADAADIPYTPVIQGIDDAALQAALEKKSLLFALADKSPDTRAALARRVDKDKASLAGVLQEHGYFGADITADVPAAVLADKGKVQVVLHIDTGAPYTIESYDVHWSEDKTPGIEALSALVFPLGQTALPSVVVGAEQDILTVLMRHGFPYPKVDARKLTVHHDRHSVSVDLYLDPGVEARFGPVEIIGLKRLERPFVARRIVWEEGAPYDIEKIAKTRKTLGRSGVVAGTVVRYGDVAADGTLPLELEVREGKHRSIGAGAAYSTTLGPVGNIFWEHRNLLGQAEKFRIKAEGGTTTTGLGVELGKPDLFDNLDLSWQSALQIRQEQLEAYDKDTMAASSVVNYKFSPTSAVSGGLALERSRIEQVAAQDDIFSLVSLPMTYRYDGTDDFLNPRQGFRFTTAVTPYQVVNRSAGFFVAESGISHYFPFGERFVWANRGRAAAIFGQSLANIPADKRLYAGGGGSVRSYGYQLLGPLDEDNYPTGGRMAVEVGTEGRYKFTETIEGVGFLEGGQVNEEFGWSGREDFLWGAGSGVRYHSPVGPLRFDVAVPLDKRESDNSFQFYMSIGQAF